MRLQKERQILAKIARKIMHENDAPYQLNIKVITKNSKNLCLHFLQVTRFVRQMTPIIVIMRKENKTYKKEAILQKSQKLVL